MNRTASVRRERTAREPGSVVLYRSAESVGKRGSRLRRSEPPPPALDLDFAARLRLHQRALRGKVEHRGALLEMVRMVNGPLEPAHVAALLVERAATWLPAPCWAVVSADLSGQLSVLADRGLTPELGSAVAAVATWVMRRGDFATADLGHDVRVSDPAVGAAMAFPLVSRGQRVGALVGLDRRPSTREPKIAPSAARAIRILLEPAAAALDNALRLKRAEAESVTDDLTNLHNSRYLKQVLRRETKRSIRSGRPLSLLFVDLDEFKLVNDNHGHLFGSRALVEAAGVIRDSARETDVTARFGGDEFAVVLPDTPPDGALMVGERVRQRIAEHHFLAADGLDIHLTASVGVATLPDVAVSPDELVQAADMAMYRVKQAGKNGIQAAIAPADT